MPLFTQFSATAPLFELPAAPAAVVLLVLAGAATAIAGIAVGIRRGRRPGAQAPLGSGATAPPGPRAAESEFAEVADAVPIGMLRLAADGTILRANQAALDLVGYPRDEYVGRPIAEFSIERAKVDDVLRRLAAGEAVRRHPARVRCKDGRIRDVLIDASGCVQDGQPAHSRWFMQDVTAAAAAYDESARLGAIIASSSDAIVGKTLDGTITSWNAAAERIFGYSAAEVVGESIFRLIPPELHDAERELLDRLRRGEPGEFTEVERVRKDGERIWIALSASPIRDASGTVVGIASIKRDITRQRAAEIELRRNQVQLRMAHEAARMGTWHWNAETNVLRWDDGLRRLYALGPDEEVSGYDDFIRRVHPEDRERVSRSVQRALHGEHALDYEFRILLPDGRVRWLADLGHAIAGPDGLPVSLAGVCMDITERKLMEEHLRDTQRMQAIGQLAGGIAHEANNQMLVVLGGAHFLLRRPDLPDGARREIEQIREAAERTAAITRQLLAFGRRQILELKDVDLNAVIETVAPVLRRSLGESHTLVLHPRPLGGTVRADPRQLEQVLVNLTLNARDAMPDGGQLTIGTAEARVSGKAAERRTVAPGTYHVLTVRDTGFGMERATLDRIFEPFFTTKDVGQGSGLGLSVVHGIVSQFGGYTRVESAPGEGTLFELYFPVVAPGPTPDGPADAPAAEGTAQGTVALIVEDDPVVRAMATRALAEAGYEILEAENGWAALEVARRQAGRLDLVVTDIGMPEMDGHELARTLRAERPGLPVLFISGYGAQGDSRRPTGASAEPALQKPFSPDALVRAAADALTGRTR